MKEKEEQEEEVWTLTYGKSLGLSGLSKIVPIYDISMTRSNPTLNISHLSSLHKTSDRGDIQAENTEMRINIAGLPSVIPLSAMARVTYSSLAHTFFVCLLPHQLCPVPSSNTLYSDPEGDEQTYW